MFKDWARRSISFLPRVRIPEFGTPRRHGAKVVVYLLQIFLALILPAIIGIDRNVTALSHVVIMQHIAVYEKKRSAAIYNMDVLGPWLTS